MKKNNIFISRGKNRHLLCLLLLCVIFLLVFLKDVRCLSLLLMVVLYKSFTNISFKRLIFYFVISFVPTIMFFSIKNFNFLTFLCNLINIYFYANFTQAQARTALTARVQAVQQTSKGR